MKQNIKYKIAIVANTTWNIYNFRMNILNILTKNNFDIYVIAPVDEYISYKENYPEITHIPLKQLGRDSTNPVKDIRLFFELKNIYKNLRPDIILHYTVKPNIYGGFAAGYLKIPSIAVVTGLGYAFIHNGIIKKITKILYRLSNRFHNKIIFENLDDKNLFIEKKLLSQNKGISVKGCGVNTQFYVAQKKLPDNKLIFTFIGRLLYDKGVVEFVESAKIVKDKYPETEFWLIGEIDHSNPAMVKEEDLLKWVKNKTVIYHGFKDDIRQFISKSDCIVLPSYREGMSRSVTEGMSMGKPIITTDTAGCREAIEDKLHGFLVPVKDISGLAQAMENIINLNSQQRMEMGKEGRKRVIEEFDDNIIADQVLAIINDVLK